MNIQFKEWTCHIVFGEYQFGKNVSMQLVDVRDGLPVATATVNPEIALDKDLVCIKDYSENEGMLNTLKEAGIVSEPIDYIQMGFVRVPVCRLLVEPFNEKELVREVSHVNWVAETPEFITYEFITCDDVWIEEPQTETDIFRLFLWKDGKREVMVANYEDYDIMEDVTELFDVDAIQESCENADKADFTEDYMKYYTEAMNQPTIIIDKR
jgi:hypothetical protein